jgi:hypothetical protein
MPDFSSGSIARAARAVYKIATVDVLALLALYYVLLDLQWRTSFAASPHDACGKFCEYSSSFGYGLLTRVFAMDGNSQHLVSPPSLDWIQVLACVLVIANLWFAYGILKARRTRLGSSTSIEPRS